MVRRPLFLVIAVLVGLSGESRAADNVVRVASPMTPPAWALLERELLRANAAACREFHAKYFDERGFLLCVERWGGDDGPDDAIENLMDWPILHALGGPDDILSLYKKSWEGHLRQFTLARTTDVPMARDGMYYKEFPVTFDWLHNGEGLVVFNLQGLSDPGDIRFQQRVRRYAGFYLNEDPDAPNYDSKHKLIRSLFNGSRGPLLRKATALDWAGDPIEIGHRFRLGHGERSYDEMLAHFKDYNDIVGDHPQNLSATTLALNAYMLAHEAKYKQWLLEYVDAWRDRMRENGGIIPTNVGLDGKIGSATDGKWWGGVYGWGFSVVVPQTGKLAHRNLHHMGLIGFGNAYLLTGDDSYLDPWRKMIDLINAQGRMIDGRMMYPHMHGADGWYDFTPAKYDQGAFDLWYWSMSDADRARLPDNGWLSYLDGKNPAYPEESLRHDFATIRNKVAAIRADTTTPDTRLADDPLDKNPATVQALNQLMLGGIQPGRRGTVLHCRVRYFDPNARRAGLPKDVAALVESLTADSTVVSLVNLSQIESRTVVIQAGGYGEHQFTSLAINDTAETPLDTIHLTIRLEPGCGTKLRLGTKRYVNQPTLAMPWGLGQ
ncbi:MAG: hypothetical protein JSS49_08440 [Planctomycetes bacterium]|nr:hypothetical protein [Planctomycetota bacterium]